MLQIEHVLDLPQGRDFYLRQDDQSAVWLYTVQDGVAKLYKALVDTGKWETLDYTEQIFHTFEKDVVGLSGNEIGDVSVLVYKQTNSMSILKMPADNNRYVYDDTYRLYWGVDSRKLYMNIAKNWEMIGTLRHELMENIGTLSHDEIEDKLAQIDQTLLDINETMGGFTNTTVNSLNGSVVLEAGDNVALSQPTGTNKIVLGTKSLTPIVTTLPTNVEAGYSCLYDNGTDVVQASYVRGQWYKVALGTT